MVSPLLIGEAFVCFLLVLGYVPVVRAYAVERDSPWLLAGFSALLLGRLASLTVRLGGPAELLAVDHGVGVALAGLLFAAHFYRGERGGARTGSARPSPSRRGGD